MFGITTVTVACVHSVAAPDGIEYVVPADYPDTIDRALSGGVGQIKFVKNGVRTTYRTGAIDYVTYRTQNDPDGGTVELHQADDLLYLRDPDAAAGEYWRLPYPYPHAVIAGRFGAEARALVTGDIELADLGDRNTFPDGNRLAFTAFYRHNTGEVVIHDRRGAINGSATRKYAGPHARIAVAATV